MFSFRQKKQDKQQIVLLAILTVFLLLVIGPFVNIATATTYNKSIIESVRTPIFNKCKEEASIYIHPRTTKPHDDAIKDCETNISLANVNACSTEINNLVKKGEEKELSRDDALVECLSRKTSQNKSYVKSALGNITNKDLLAHATTTAVDDITNLLRFEYKGDADLKRKVEICSDKISESIKIGQPLTNNDALLKCLNLQTSISKKTIKNILANAGEAELPSEDEATEEEVECADTIEGMGWLVCPLMNFMAKLLDGAFAFVSGNFLEVEASLIEDDSVQVTWRYFRNIANAVFILLFLFVIFSQVSNLGVSNYGIKKLLPKIIIVAVLVNLSLLICQILVDLSNILGYALKDIFSAPIPDIANATNVDTKASDSVKAAFASGGTAVLGTAVAAYFLLPVLGSVLLAGLIAVLIVVMILIARKAIIIILTVTSPIAFLLLLLPNTEKLFKKWRDLMVAMFLLFPLVGLVFGGAFLASTVIEGIATREDAQLMKVVALAIQTIPLFAIIPLVKSSFNATGQIGATVSRLGDRLSKAGWERGRKTRLGQFGDYLKGEREKRRAQTQSGAYSYTGKNPFKKIRSRVSDLNKSVNERIPGGFGRRTAAAGLDLIKQEDDKKINELMTLMAQGVAPEKQIDSLKNAYFEAHNRGDTLSKRAAIRSLGSMGPNGVQAIGKLVDDSKAKMFGEDKYAIQKEVIGLGLDSKDNALAKWATSGGSLSEIRADSETLGNLSPESFSTQYSYVFDGLVDGDANTIKVVNEVLDSPQLRANLKPGALEKLEKYRNKKENSSRRTSQRDYGSRQRRPTRR